MLGPQVGKDVRTLSGDGRVFGEGEKGSLAPVVGTAKAAQGLWGATQNKTEVWHEGG